MHIALVGKPAINLDGLLVVAKEVWGHSLAAKLDERHLPAGDVEKFLVCLAGFQSGQPESSVPKHLLALVHLSWLVIGDSDILNSALNWLPTAERIIVPTEKRGFAAAWVQTRLDEAITAIEFIAHYTKDDQVLFAGMQTQLDQHGLLHLGQPVVATRQLGR